MHRNLNLSSILPAVLWGMLLTACYHEHSPKSKASTAELADDSLTFAKTHHYTNNYNFVVKADSLVLFSQQPEEINSGLATDSIVVPKHTHLVVADIRIMPNDKTDSVWIQLAKDQYTFGWTQESRLLPAVVPDDPISQFISTFSDTHLLIFLVVICIIAAAYLIRTLLRRNAHLVHINDIDSFYPALLALTVATAATFYASIQLFAPDTWRHFYYHPTLNPFSVPPLLSIFLCSVWAILILAVAVVDVVHNRLPRGEAVLYLFGLIGVCAINYIVFSITTLYYVGYTLLAIYFFFAIHHYYRSHRPTLLCGRCGRRIPSRGICPHCGAVNN